jgi:hypothetical protein
MDELHRHEIKLYTTVTAIPKRGENMKWLWVKCTTHGIYANFRKDSLCECFCLEDLAGVASRRLKK